jgi:SsrA-binding protein
MGKVISFNRRAFHDWDIKEKIEAGIVLTGAEIKSIRAGKVSLKASFAKILIHGKKPEAFLINMNVGDVVDGDRTRKLLLHAAQINRLLGQLQQKGYSLVPLQLYLKKGRAKIELGVGKAKKMYEKREALKRRDIERDIQREMRGKE